MRRFVLLISVLFLATAIATSVADAARKPCRHNCPPPTTTTTSSVPESTSTTTAATTTTQAPTTTTTMVMPTTTSTTAPPAGTFLATFDTPEDFFGRFNTDMGNYVDKTRTRRTADYIAAGGDSPRYTFGDHDENCSGPMNLRTLDNADPDLTKYFYWCAPGGAGTGHIMTAFDTSGYTVNSFSPKVSFNNVTQVCWSINATNEGAGKWTNMIIVPETLYQQFAPSMDYVAPGFNVDNEVGDFNIQQPDHPGSSVWGVKDFLGGQHPYFGDNTFFDDFTMHVTTDKMARYRHCVTKTSASTSSLTVDRPEGGTSTYTIPSAIPSGQVRVIFQDDMYDPPKRADYSDQHVTWHWDDVSISAG